MPHIAYFSLFPQNLKNFPISAKFIFVKLTFICLIYFLLPPILTMMHLCIMLDSTRTGRPCRQANSSNSTYELHYDTIPYFSARANKPGYMTHLLSHLT